MDERNKFLKMSSIYKNEKLSKYNWFNLGGPAKLFIKIDKIEELKNFLLENNTKNAKIHILGIPKKNVVDFGDFILQSNQQWREAIKEVQYDYNII